MHPVLLWNLWYYSLILFFFFMTYTYNTDFWFFLYWLPLIIISISFANMITTRYKEKYYKKARVRR